MHPTDAELAQLLNQFVPVRITSFKGVDMNFFKFDYDQTFAVLMMSPDGTVYSRYGSNDAKMDAGRMSVPGLKQAMRQVLNLHNSGWKPLQPVSQASPTKPFTLTDIPAYARGKAAEQACAHCHYANNFRFKQLMAEGKFTKDLLFQYPFPENIGITLDVDRNNVVKAVLPDSPALRAGIAAGDTILTANAARVLSSADLQYVLNSVPDAATVSLVVQRVGHQLPAASLRLAPGWRKSDISWRPSTEVVPPSVGIWGEELKPAERKVLGLADGTLALRASFFFPGAKWAQTRGALQRNDVIVGIEGVALHNMSTRQFHAYFRTHFNVGDTATLKVLRGQQKLDIKVPCMDAGGED